MNKTHKHIYIVNKRRKARATINKEINNQTKKEQTK